MLVALLDSATYDKFGEGIPTISVKGLGPSPPSTFLCSALEQGTIPSDVSNNAINVKLQHKAEDTVPTHPGQIRDTSSKVVYHC